MLRQVTGLRESWIDMTIFIRYHAITDGNHIIHAYTAKHIDRIKNHKAQQETVRAPIRKIIITVFL